MIGRLSLSFENGPTPGITERILEVLARHGLRITFFVIGEKLRDKAAAGLPAEMAAAGHWIGNHTSPIPLHSATAPMRPTPGPRSKRRKRSSAPGPARRNCSALTGKT